MCTSLAGLVGAAAVLAGQLQQGALPAGAVAAPAQGCHGDAVLLALHSSTRGLRCVRRGLRNAAAGGLSAGVRGCEAMPPACIAACAQELYEQYIGRQLGVGDDNSAEAAASPAATLLPNLLCLPPAMQLLACKDWDTRLTATELKAEASSPECAWRVAIASMCVSMQHLTHSPSGRCTQRHEAAAAAAASAGAVAISLVACHTLARVGVAGRGTGSCAGRRAGLVGMAARYRHRLLSRD